MRTLSKEKVVKLINEADKEWPKGAMHLQIIVQLRLLLDIRETLIEIRRKLNEAK